MIFNVCFDLLPFLLFYTILCWFSSNFFAILGLGNFNVDSVYRTNVIKAWEGLEAGNKFVPGTKFEGPAIYNKMGDFDDGNGLLMMEYLYLNKYFAYILSTFNISLGNFDFAP